MRPVKIILPILMLPIILGLVSHLPVQAGNEPCKSLINVYCTRCHTTERICNALGNTDERAWKITIKEMGEYDGEIDQKTQSQVVSCVGKMKKGDRRVCKK